MRLKKILRKTLRRVPWIIALREYIQTQLYLKKRYRKHPEFRWKHGARGPEKRVEATRIQVGSKLYVFGGYITLANVSSRIDVYDMETNQWQHLGFMPEDVAQTHNGAAYDGNNHIYFISGQIGALCSPASTICHSLKLTDLSWKKIPPLPVARYMPLVHFHNGRVHCLSGTDVDRMSQTYDHWSIEVIDGEASESEWRVDPRLSSARTHTASYLINDEILVFGGQTGDLPRINNSPPYSCNFDTPIDLMLDESYAFHLESGKLRLLAPMPEKISHTEHAVIRVGSKIVIPGGVFDRHKMCDLIFSYDLNRDDWEIIGRLPYPMKSKVVGFWNNRIYLVCGQRSISEYDLRPGKVLDSVWYADMPY
jgi:N-acetylneuraminic acid mutarotase